MNENPFKTKKFKTLQRQWYRKLKKIGFQEIEDTIRGIPIQWDSRYFKSRYTPKQFEEKMRYYEIARDILNTYCFLSSQEKTIWEWHASGLSVREIAKTMKLKNWVVHNTITKIFSDIFGRKRK